MTGSRLESRASRACVLCCMTVICRAQGRIIQPESSCIVYYMYYIILCIISCIIFTYDFKTIRPKSNSIIHNTQYNTYYVLIRIMYCHTLLGHDGRRYAMSVCVYGTLSSFPPFPPFFPPFSFPFFSSLTALVRCRAAAPPDFIRSYIYRLLAVSSAM